MKNTNKWLITTIALLGGLYQLYIAAFGTDSTMSLRVTHWIFMAALCFLVYPISKKQNLFTKILDYVAVVAAVAPGFYILKTWSQSVMTIGLPTTLEVIFGIILVITVLEAARRTAGLTLTIVSGLFLAYALFGHMIPGVLGHREYSIDRLSSYLYLTMDGIYGIALGVSATYIVLFILFGAFLNVAGGGKLFIDLALGLTGKKKGGPAKAAIVSSAIMGTISGSPVGNVVTTGTYTIPLMKKSGYKDYEAGAIEAVASTGGMIAPPVMGAAAFIMADYLEVPYTTILLAAVFPAFLYYMSLFISAHLRANKKDLQAAAKEDLPDAKQAFKKGWYLLIPLVLLIVWLVIGWTPIKAAFYSIVSMFAIMLISPDRKNALKNLVVAIEDGIRGAIPVAAATAVAGIIVGVVNLTGLAVKFTSYMIQISNGSPLLMLIGVAFASLILGMGLPATAVYILLAALTAPALVEVGFTPLASHMFVFYFGIISAITPPVALCAYAASGISKSNPNKTGVEAFKFGMVAYIIPFIFAFNPALLMEGALTEIIVVATTSIIGVTFFAFGLERFIGQKLTGLEQILAFIGSIMLMIPESITDILGFAILVILVAKYKLRLKSSDNKKLDFSA
jgi:TRAP transporter 4TM/12TM fusion protein